MTHLVLAQLSSIELVGISGIDFVGEPGMWLFLSIGAISLFGIFLPVAVWMENRHKEREAYYRAEAIRRATESSGDGAKAVMELLREEARLKTIKMLEGLKIPGIINVAFGVALVIFLRVLLHGYNGPALAGLIPGLIGLAMLGYVFFMAKPAE